MAFDLHSLFDTHAELPKYVSVREELNAVAAGTKGMSVFLFPNSLIGTDSFYNELCKMASDLNISTTLREKLDLESESNLLMSYLFIFRDNESWRIPAYLAVKRVCEYYGWSDAAEHLESSLLGYTDEEISSWLRIHSSSRASWTGKTFFFLMPSIQADNVRLLGKRSISPSVITEPLRVFFSRNRNPMRVDAYSRIPSQHELMRVSVREKFFRDVFGSPSASTDGDVVVSTITRDTAAALNSALDSSFQFFGPDGWH